jgi:hypothetical protein
MLKYGKRNPAVGGSKKVKVFCYKPEVALGVPGGSGSWISTFGTMKVVRSSPLGTAAFTPMSFPGTHF